jgi:hypothetical protein
MTSTSVIMAKHGPQPQAAVQGGFTAPKQRAAERRNGCHGWTFPRRILKVHGVRAENGRAGAEGSKNNNKEPMAYRNVCETRKQ